MPVDGPISSYDVTSISAYSLNNIMHVNQDALHSMQVFAGKAHPNMHKGASEKQALSLWSIFSNETVTPLGKILLRKWFLRPVIDLKDLNSRHDSVEKLTLVSSESTSTRLKTILRGVKNVKRVLTRMKTNVSMVDWLQLVKVPGFQLISAVCAELSPYPCSVVRTSKCP